MPVPSAGTLTGDSNSPGGHPVPVIISGTLRCSACRLESSGTGVTDDPRTATTGNQRGYSHIRGENRSEQAQKHAQQTFGDAIGKSFDDAVARFSFPAWMLQLLRKARDRIIHLLVTLWDRLF